MSVEGKAADITGPVLTAGNGGVKRFEGEEFAILLPRGLTGRFLDMQATQDIEWGFAIVAEGATPATIILGELSDFTAGSAACGFPLRANVFNSAKVPNIGSTKGFDLYFVATAESTAFLALALAEGSGV